MSSTELSRLDADDYRLLRLMLDLIDRLAAGGGWDPAELVNPRTNQTFGPVLERTRTVVRRYETQRGASRRASAVPKVGEGSSRARRPPT